MACNCNNNAKKQRKIERLKKRLDHYYDQEAAILEGRAKAYAIGSRNLTRYDVPLAEVRQAIEDLEKQLDELESCHARRAVATVIRDW